MRMKERSAHRLALLLQHEVPLHLRKREQRAVLEVVRERARLDVLLQRRGDRLLVAPERARRELRAHLAEHRDDFRKLLAALLHRRRHRLVLVRLLRGDPLQQEYHLFREVRRVPAQLAGRQLETPPSDRTTHLDEPLAAVVVVVEFLPKVLEGQHYRFSSGRGLCDNITQLCTKVLLHKRKGSLHVGVALRHGCLKRQHVTWMHQESENAVYIITLLRTARRTKHCICIISD